jgi:O2-independent ubiquinone biosynthesis accessory factor UbiT
MKPTSLPTPIVRGAMHVTPPFVLSRAVDALMRRMERAHPKLFKNLARLKPAVVHVEPSDLPHRFELKYGGDEKAKVRLLQKWDKGTADAYVKGNIDILLNLLEGRIDGDALFFTRGLVITGDTAAIVALRNTLDREEIDLFADITGMFGPLAKPVGRALTALGRIRENAKTRAAAVHESFHENEGGAGDWKTERETLQNEIKTLKTRLAKLEVREKKKASEHDPVS